MVTSKDVARRAGVSQTTVSRVLQNKGNVNEKTRERVQHALESLGYVPNERARAMRTGYTNVLGVVTGRITNPFYPELIDALSTAISGCGLRMVLWGSDSDSGEAAALEAIRGGQIDGVIFTTAMETSAPLRSALELDVPLVLVVRSIDGAPCDQVTSDNESGGWMAAQHFLAAGRVDLAVLGGHESVSTSRERRAGFLSAAKAHGIAQEDVVVEDCDFAHAAAKDRALSILSDPDGPRSIFCVNDVIAFGVLDAAHELGLSVPDDVWVIGYDNIEMASWRLIDLTTVTQPIEAMARTAVELLLRRLREPDSAWEHVRFPPELVLRGSAPA